jgi:hypothetical protein
MCGGVLDFHASTEVFFFFFNCLSFYDLESITEDIDCESVYYFLFFSSSENSPDLLLVAAERTQTH